jgi:hypothetical protein
MYGAKAAAKLCTQGATQAGLAFGDPRHTRCLDLHETYG